MKTTKEHIAGHALKQFNENGLANVRLQHIADSAFVSVGHLAYHFKNKAAIVEWLFEQWQQEDKTVMAEFRVVSLFEDVDRYLLSVFEMQKRFAFLYFDALEIVRTYPEIQAKRVDHFNWQLAQLKMMIEFNTARGSFRRIEPTQLNAVSRLLQLGLNAWSYGQRIVGESTVEFEQFRGDIWQLLLPYFSEMGNNEYNQLKLLRKLEK